MAETCVEMVSREVEAVHAAGSELDIRDPLVCGVALCLGEFLSVQIDADDVTDRVGKTERDRPSAAAHVEDTVVAGQVREEEVGVRSCVPVLQERLERRRPRYRISVQGSATSAGKT
jgi:hypothetical protein